MKLILFLIILAIIAFSQVRHKLPPLWGAVNGPSSASHLGGLEQ